MTTNPEHGSRPQDAAKDEGARVAGHAKEAAQDVAGSARREARQVTGEATDQIRSLLVVLVTASMLALFTIKITGFISGGLICLYAFAAGRLTFRQAATAALAFLAALGLLEITTGMVSAYLRDIYALVADNTDALAPRMVQSLSLNFGVVAPAGALVLLLLWHERAKLSKLWRGSASRLSDYRSMRARQQSRRRQPFPQCAKASSRAPCSSKTS